MKYTTLPYSGMKLKVGRVYLYGGVNESLYSVYHWSNTFCRIKKIYKEEKQICIVLFDFSDGKTYTFARDSTLSNAVFFKRWWNFKG